MAKSSKTVELIETRKGCAMMEKESRYDVHLRGEKVGQLYFNMRGYVGLLPTPDGMVDIGEVSISKFKKEVAQINREFKAAEPLHQAFAALT
jgi:hypothetical protein